jgi:hypothetical protein
MALQATGIRLSGGYDHEHIALLWWTNPSAGTSGCDSRATVVRWIEDGVKVFVEQGGKRSEVAVVTPKYGEKYLRTRADGVWTDNLLALPRR